MMVILMIVLAVTLGAELEVVLHPQRRP